MSHFSSSKECIRNCGKMWKTHTKKDKTSPRPPFDQHCNLITCIAKTEKAFIWIFQSHSVRRIQRDGSTVKHVLFFNFFKVERDVNDNRLYTTHEHKENNSARSNRVTWIVLIQMFSKNEGLKHRGHIMTALLIQRATCGTSYLHLSWIKWIKLHYFNLFKLQMLC